MDSAGCVAGILSERDIVRSLAERGSAALYEPLVIWSMAEYGYDPGVDEPLLFGKVKIWGEIVEHQEGYRSEFGKIVSLDYGDLELLQKFRRIYRVNESTG